MHSEDVDPLTLLSAIAFPLLLFVGGVAAWQMSKHRDTEEQGQATWRDDSLDEWRRERDEQIERERAERVRDRARYQPGSAEEQEEAARHQRIGG